MSSYPLVKFLTSADATRQFPADPGVEVSVAGRSNAGKSSAINAIAQRKGLARTSKTPGATRLINFFELEPGRRLVDLPGYGFAAVPGEMRRHWGQLIAGYFQQRHSLRGSVVVMDVRHPLTEIDCDMLELAAVAAGAGAHPAHQGRQARARRGAAGAGGRAPGGRGGRRRPAFSAWAARAWTRRGGPSSACSTARAAKRNPGWTSGSNRGS